MCGHLTRQMAEWTYCRGGCLGVGNETAMTIKAEWNILIGSCVAALLLLAWGLM